jgi:hypothetical protein
VPTGYHSSGTEAPLTAGGEHNKVTWNIALGMDYGAIHYRSAQIESMQLREEVATRFL